MSKKIAYQEKKEVEEEIKEKYSKIILRILQ
jgi:hypothetical protein